MRPYNGPKPIEVLGAAVVILGIGVMFETCGGFPAFMAAITYP